MKILLALLLVSCGFSVFGADKNIAELKQDLNIEHDATSRFNLMSRIAGHYSSEKLTKETAPDAKTMAETLLADAGNYKKNWDYGNAVHHAHLVLGRISLMDGNINEAKSQLKLAGQTPGSPQLNSFGPNMTLAKELLDKGEKAAVLDYFADCLKFWEAKFGKPEVDKWTADIAKGKIPDFGGNLEY